MTFQHSERALRELFERRRATALGIFAEERNGFFVVGGLPAKGAVHRLELGQPLGNDATFAVARWACDDRRCLPRAGLRGGPMNGKFRECAGEIGDAECE